MTNACIQNWNVKRTAEWRRDWGKPIVNDELEYEGDISLAWGNISAREMVHRCWLTLTRGGYAGHGEVSLIGVSLLWWAKGGPLRGESWKRIAFLRSIVEADVRNGLAPAAGGGVALDSVCPAASMATIGSSTSASTSPRCGWRDCPTTMAIYEVDVIDTWEMTITPAKHAPSPVFPAPATARRGNHGSQADLGLRRRTAGEALPRLSYSRAGRARA